MKEEFEKYVSTFDMNNKKVLGKYNHSIRVMELAQKYAKLLNFNEKDTMLATLIGLLHDFGRFEQVRVYDSFNDLQTIDHADYSAEQLFDKGLIKNFTEDEQYYPLIEFAIRNHNKKEIAKTSNEQFKKHAYFIRDMDKVDIMRAISNELKTQPDDSEISKEVLDTIKQHKTVDRSLNKTKNDRIATQYAFAFDIHNDIVLKEYKENFIKFHNNLNDKEKFKEIYEETIKYIDERIDNYERNKN